MIPGMPEFIFKATWTKEERDSIPILMPDECKVMIHQLYPSLSLCSMLAGSLWKMWYLCRNANMVECLSCG